jgi:hypothetical protein
VSERELDYAMFCFVSLYARTCVDLQEKMLLRNKDARETSISLRLPIERSARLKSPHFSKEGVLLPGNDDLFVVGEDEGDARTIKKARLPDVHEVNDAIAGRPKERRRIQPVLAFSKCSPQNYSTSRHGDARSTAKSFEKPDVGCSDQPALPLAAEEDKIIGAQDAFMLFYDGAGRLLWLQLLESFGL